MRNYTKRTVFAVLVVFLFSTLAALFSYLFRLLLARRLSLEDFGLFFSLVAFGGILFLLKDMGLSQSLYYFVPRLASKKDKGKVRGIVSKSLKINFFTAAAVSILMIILSGFLAERYFHTEKIYIILLFAVSFFLNCLELLFQGFFGSFQNQVLFSVHNLMRSVFVFFICLTGFFLFSGIVVPVVAYILTYILLIAIFGFLFFKKVFPDYFSLKSKSEFPVKKLFLFGLSASMLSLGFLLIASTDTLVLTYFRSLSEVGLYNAVLPIINLMLYLPIAAGIVILPMSGELWLKKDVGSLKFIIEKITKYLFIFLIPIGMILFLYPELALRILFGQDFVLASSALMILSIGAIFYGISNFNLSVLFGVTGPKINTIIWASAAIFNVIANIILVPFYGIMGAAIATSISYILLFLLSSIFLYRRLEMPFDYKRYILIFVLCSICMYLVSFLKNMMFASIYLKIVFLVAVSLLFYGLALLLFRLITVDEMNSMIRMFFSKKSKA